MGRLYKTNISIIVFIIGFYPSIGVGQVQNISITQPCAFDNNGSIEISLDSSQLTAYDLPFNLDWEDLVSGEYEDDISIENYNITISDIPSGEYVITLYLDAGCFIKIDTIVEADETDLIDVYPRVYNPDCGYNNGLISVQAFGGTPPYISLNIGNFIHKIPISPVV